MRRPNMSVGKAGLFSSVGTTFVVEVYKRLQPDPQDITNHHLDYLSSQFPNLAAAMINGSMSEKHTIPSPTPFTFQALYVDVVINSLWFSSLIYALIAASMSTLIKQ